MTCDCGIKTYEIIACHSCGRQTCEKCAAHWDPEPPCKAECLACQRERKELEAYEAACNDDDEDWRACHNPDWAHE